jgi:predicted DNA-binding protein
MAQLGPNTMQTSLKLPKDMKAQLDEITAKTGKPMSRMIREALIAYLADHPAEKEAKAA